jgi:hypothetical protein
VALPARNRLTNLAATFARHTEAIKRLEQKEFYRRFVFVLKRSAMYASFGAIDTPFGASFTVATYQDGAALELSMFFPWGRDNPNYARTQAPTLQRETNREQKHNRDNGRRGYRARWSPTPSTRR